MDLNVYGPDHIESFLLNYKLLVKDLPELAADWPNLDDEERSDHRAALMQIWGNRKVLGLLFRAHRLTLDQEGRLAEFDRLLLEGASLMQQCYGLDLTQLLAIFRWGTSLSGSSRTLRIEVDSTSLDRVAAALAPSPTY